MRPRPIGSLAPAAVSGARRASRRSAVAALLIALVGLPAAGAIAQELTGPATVVGSDTIKIGGQRVMLYGLESVESAGQTCTIDGRTWECWAAAVRQLQTLVEAGPVTCVQIGERDLLGRVLGTCTVGGEDLGGAFVRSGFALAVAKEVPAYEAIEAEARAARIGLWQGQFLRPREWRTMNSIEADRP